MRQRIRDRTFEEVVMKYTEPELEPLVARLEKLEAQNRKWKLASILLGLSSLSLVLMAAKSADHLDPRVVHARTVEAQDFVLKDEDGQVRARLTLNANKFSHDRNILDPKPSRARDEPVPLAASTQSRRLVGMGAGRVGGSQAHQ